jgi:meiotic recombination protein SPO11
LGHGILTVQDVLIPRVADIESIDISEVKWVLIVEKEAGTISDNIFKTYNYITLGRESE